MAAEQDNQKEVTQEVTMPTQDQKQLVVDVVVVAKTLVQLHSKKMNKQLVPEPKLPDRQRMRPKAKHMATLLRRASKVEAERIRAIDAAEVMIATTMTSSRIKIAGSTSIIIWSDLNGKR